MCSGATVTSSQIIIWGSVCGMLLSTIAALLIGESLLGFGGIAVSMLIGCYYAEKEDRCALDSISSDLEKEQPSLEEKES